MLYHFLQGYPIIACQRMSGREYDDYRLFKKLYVAKTRMSRAVVGAKYRIQAAC